MLWGFIRLGASLSYSDLCDTIEYQVMCEAVHNPDTCGAIRVSIGGPGGMFMHMVPGVSRPGVRWCGQTESYTFDSAEVLLNELPFLLSQDAPDALRSALERCNRRIHATLQTMDLADDLEAMGVR